MDHTAEIFDCRVRAANPDLEPESRLWWLLHAHAWHTCMAMHRSADSDGPEFDGDLSAHQVATFYRDQFEAA